MATQQERYAVYKSWLAKCSPRLLAQFEDGLLSESDVLDLMRDSFFRPLDAFPRFRRIREDEAADAYRTKFGRNLPTPVRFTVRAPATLSPEQQARAGSIKLRMWLHQHTIREHVALVGDIEVMSRLSVLVEGTMTGTGGIFSREYSLDAVQQNEEVRHGR